MFQFLRDLFSEKGSNVSSIRVAMMMCVCAAIAIAIIGINKPIPDYSGISLLCTGFLSVGMGTKLLQKRTEVNGSQSETVVDSKQEK